MVTFSPLLRPSEGLLLLNCGIKLKPNMEATLHLHGPKPLPLPQVLIIKILANRGHISVFLNLRLQSKLFSRNNQLIVFSITICWPTKR